MTFKRNLLVGGAAVVALGGAAYLSRRAVIHNASALLIDGSSTSETRVVLTYGEGTRPLSVIIDLVAGNGASGSATIDGETTDVIIPLSAPLAGLYSITTTATYRLLGLPNTTVRTFAGGVADPDSTS